MPLTSLPSGISQQRPNSTIQPFNRGFSPSAADIQFKRNALDAAASSRQIQEVNRSRSDTINYSPPKTPTSNGVQGSTKGPNWFDRQMAAEREAARARINQGSQLPSSIPNYQRPGTGTSQISPENLTGRRGINPNNFRPSSGGSISPSAAMGTGTLGATLGAQIVPDLAKNWRERGNPLSFPPDYLKPADPSQVSPAGQRARKEAEEARRWLGDRAKDALEAAKDALKRLFPPQGRPAPDPNITRGPNHGQPGALVHFTGGYILTDRFVSGRDVKNPELRTAAIAPVYWAKRYSAGNFLTILRFSGDMPQGSVVWAGMEYPGESRQPYINVFPSLTAQTPVTPEPAPAPFADPYQPERVYLPDGFPSPNPSPKAPPRTAPRPNSPVPTPKPDRGRLPKLRPRPNPGPGPTPGPAPGPNADPPRVVGPDGAPTTTTITTTTITRLDPDPKKRADPDPPRDPYKDPYPNPPMNCEDPCIGAIQESQQKAEKEQEKKKTRMIGVKVFRDCNGPKGAARFLRKEVKVPADEVGNYQLLYEQLANSNAMRCELETVIAQPEEQLRRRPKSIPEMVLFFQTVKKQGNGKRSNYSLTVFHWNKPKGFKPRIPNITKGNIVKIVVLTDGSRLTVSGKTKQDCNRLMTALLANVPNELKKGDSFVSKFASTFKENNKVVEVEIVRGKYYQNGYQAGVNPDWIIEYKK